MIHRLRTTVHSVYGKPRASKAIIIKSPLTFAVPPPRNSPFSSIFLPFVHYSMFIVVNFAALNGATTLPRLRGIKNARTKGGPRARINRITKESYVRPFAALVWRNNEPPALVTGAAVCPALSSPSTPFNRELPFLFLRRRFVIS